MTSTKYPSYEYWAFDDPRTAERDELAWFMDHSDILQRIVDAKTLTELWAIQSQIRQMQRSILDEHGIEVG